MKKFITLTGNKITGIRHAKEIVDGEIESELGELGQLLQPDGTFIDDPQDILDRQKYDRINEINLRLQILRNKKDLFDFGGLTQEQYEPFRLEAIELLEELTTLE